MSEKNKRKGLVIVNTGNGKGKSTAAFGTMFRAIGRGFSVGVVQFIKGDWETGEKLVCDKIPQIEFHSMGLGFTWESDDLNRDMEAARAAWEKAKEFLADENKDLVILDELTYCFHFNWISEDEVLKALEEKPSWKHVIITGRDCPDSILNHANLVTEMNLVKHPFDDGIPAQKGIEF